MTAIGICPTADRGKIKKLVSSIPLLGKNYMLAQESESLPVVQSQSEHHASVAQLVER